MTKHPTFRLKSAAYLNGLQVHVLSPHPTPPKKIRPFTCNPAGGAKCLTRALIATADITRLR